jgi:predicted LPLAT superfamily acyltransferase
MSQHWAQMREAGFLSGLRFMVMVYKFLGRAVFNIVLVPVMAYFFIRKAEVRRASFDFLRKVQRAYPEVFPKRPLAWLSFIHLISFGQSLLDKFIAWGPNPPEISMDPAEEEMLFELVNSGKGVMIVGSHFGNIEYARGISLRHPELVINVLMYDQHSEKFSGLLRDARNQTSMNIIQVSSIDLELALTLKQRVERGEWVVIAGDRVPVSNDGRVCQTQFFGEPANFPVGPYVLANLLRCPVYLMHCYRLGDHYHVNVELFSESFKTTRNNRQRDYELGGQRFADSLEKYVAKYPLQWYNFFDFWEDLNRTDEQNEQPTHYD